jgi:surface carbohydrate biosynthesis protein
MSLHLSPRRWILSPIAIKSRDLDGNALLAFAAAERGFGVLLGNAKLKTKHYTPRGFIIEKNLRRGKAYQFVQSSRDRGHKVGAWCDEGLIYKDAETYRRLKFDDRAYDQLDAYFTWGQNQADDLVHRLGCSGEKICITGNPRFDVHRPDVRCVLTDRVAAIQRKYGPYILVNTKFSTFNGFAGSEKNILGMKARGMLETPEHEEHAKGLQSFQGAIFTAFMQMIEELSSRFREETVVVRPHPSEDHKPWRAMAAKLPNVKVVYQGNVVEWILASEVCVHNNCTTGVEAFLLGKSSISYRPVRDPRYDFFLPNALSTEANTPDQLRDFIDESLRGNNLKGSDVPTKTRATARHFIANMDGRWACDAILDAISETDLPEVSLRFCADAGERLSNGIRRCLRPLRQLGISKKRAVQERFARQKFDQLKRAELLVFLKAAQEATGRFADVQVAQLEDDVVCVY